MTNKGYMQIAAAIMSTFMIGGCGGPGDADQPPTVRIDVDACAECGMIISDERFATATIVPGDRGPQAILFDDFNCQANYEKAHAEMQVLKRWAHDHDSLVWLDAGSAHYIRAKTLYTPMMAHIAAFESMEAAAAMAKEHTGEQFTFEEMWGKLLAGEETAGIAR